ncbi:MAG: DinB family protein [Acidobacteria bacterium]|nr:DinB family protein [Acidobacteriota bacterium]
MSVFTNSASSSPEEIAGYVKAVLGLVEGRDPIGVLRATPQALRDAVAPLDTRELRVPEPGGKWSINEALQHLADSDLVFGWRIRLILAHDRPVITGYDQDLWAGRLHYSEGNPAEALERFAVLRRSNVGLLERASEDAPAPWSAHRTRRGNAGPGHKAVRGTRPAAPAPDRAHPAFHPRLRNWRTNATTSLNPPWTGPLVDAPRRHRAG